MPVVDVGLLAREFKSLSRETSPEGRVAALEIQVARLLGLLTSDAEARSGDLLEEVNELPEAEEGDIARAVIVRNEADDDVINIGITATDGTPIWVGINTLLAPGQLILGMEILEDLNNNEEGVWSSPEGGWVQSQTQPTGEAVLVAYDGFGDIWWVSDTEVPDANIQDHRYMHVTGDNENVYCTGRKPGTNTSYIDKFLAIGNYIGRYGSYGTGNGQYKDPVGLISDIAGDALWVVDSGNNRIQKLVASTMVYESQFGTTGSGPGEFSNPTAIELAQGFLYVLDAGNFRVQLFDAVTHAYSTELPFEPGNGDDQIGDGASGLGVDESGNLWISDTANHRIQVFTPLGDSIATYGNYGEELGQMKSPRQLNMNLERIGALVADAGNKRTVSLYSIGGPSKPGPLLTQRIGSTTAIPSGGGTSTASATCDTGEIAAAGAYRIDGARGELTEDDRSSTTSWSFTARNDSGALRRLTAQVVCWQDV